MLLSAIQMRGFGPMSLCLYSKSEISYGERTIKAADWRDKLRI